MYGFSEQNFGFLLSMNAAMVVLFQLWIAEKISKYDPMKMMALGALFYMVGFGMYGFISEFYLFFVAMIIITIGEMIVSPVSQKAVAKLSPKDKRGRYMGMLGFTWTIPSIFGVYLAGLVSVYIGPNWIWYFGGIICFISAIGYYLLRKVAKERFIREEDAQENDEIELVEI
jgi:MFS family permease